LKENVRCVTGARESNEASRKNQILMAFKKKHRGNAHGRSGEEAKPTGKDCSAIHSKGPSCIGDAKKSRLAARNLYQTGQSVGSEGEKRRRQSTCTSRRALREAQCGHEKRLEKNQLQSRSKVRRSRSTRNQRRQPRCTHGEDQIRHAAVPEGFSSDRTNKPALRSSKGKLGIQRSCREKVKHGPVRRFAHGKGRRSSNHHTKTSEW